MELIFHFLPWHWWVAGILLIILEMLAPTGHTLWLGVAALVVGALLWLFPQLDWKLQLLLFAVLSVASVLLYRQYARKKQHVTDEPSLNRRGERYIGRVFTLDEPIINGVGKIRVDDTTWRVTGPDRPAGETVKVISVDGSTLQVVPEP